MDDSRRGAIVDRSVPSNETNAYDDALRAFLQVVGQDGGTTREEARKFVEAADGDVNRALNFYLNGNSAENCSASTSPRCETLAASLGSTQQSPSVREKQCFLDMKGGARSAIIRKCIEGGTKFKDPDFPPEPSSIDGRSGNQGLGTSKIICLCGAPAKLQRVYKDGPNQGRLFYCCLERKCRFFSWTNTAPHTTQAQALKWKRFNAQEHIPVSRQNGFRPSDVLQGAVGDCWFLSGLAVIAERHDLIERIFPFVEKSAQGVYEVRLFLDGEWREIVVDDFLPVAKQGKLAFAKHSQNQIWVPLVEKAYAKAHSSYQAISGGFVSEAMFDLTGFPTEVISFDDSAFDSEVTWARLLSFSKANFPMGCATSLHGSVKDAGLVGCHAYSILEVVELEDAKPGVQLQVDEMFAGASKRQRTQPKQKPTCLRLLRIRNLWGKREWMGDWSDQSELWTGKLHAKLGKTQKNDGTFWMSYADFLCRFSMIEVCKAHKDWFTTSLRVKGLDSCILNQSTVRQYSLTTYDTTWCHLMLIQRTKRGCISSDYWYGDLNFTLWKVENGRRSLQKVFFGGQDKNAFVEMVLGPGVYFLCLFTLSKRGIPSSTVRVFSANPVSLLEKQQLAATRMPSLLHESLLYDTDCIKRQAHRISEDVVLMLIQANKAGIFMVCANQSRDRSNAIAMQVQADDIRIVSQSGGNFHAGVPPLSQRIICVLLPKKVGEFKFVYNWKLTLGAAASLEQEGPVLSSAFQPISPPLSVNPKLHGDSKFEPEGSATGLAKFTCSMY